MAYLRGAAPNEAYTVPASYVHDAETVLAMLPDMLSVTIARCALANKFPHAVRSAEELANLFRTCVCGDIIVSWDDFTDHCRDTLEPHPDSGLYLPWEDLPQMERLITQAAWADTAGTLVANRVTTTWHLFLQAVQGTPDNSPPISWLSAEQLRQILYVPPGIINGSLSKCLLHHVLRAMAGHDDTAAAAEAAASLNRRITDRHRKPVVDLPLGPRVTWRRLMVRIKDLFRLDCRKRDLSAALDAADIIDSSASEFNLYGCIGRLLQNAASVPLLARNMDRPVCNSMLRSVRLRGHLTQAFRLAHSQPAGVSTAALLAYLDGCPSPKPGWFPFLVTCFERALTVMFSRFPGYVTSWKHTLASMLACLCTGTDPAKPAGRERHKAVLAIARRMVTGTHPATVVHFGALAEHVLALPPMTAGMQSYHFRPANDKARNVAVIADALFNGCIAPPMSPRLANIALDGVEEEGGAVLPPHVDAAFELTFGMPSPHALAMRMDVAMRYGGSAAMWPVASVGLLWNMARHVRGTLPAATPASPSRKRAREQVCMACMEAAVNWCGTCEHVMCGACAVSALETRIRSVVAGDASTEEQTHGDIGKCAQPGCNASLLWAADGLTTDTRFMLRRVQACRNVQRLCAAGTHVKCYLCWAASEAGVDGVTTCMTCTETTCNTCSQRSHPGDLCPAVMRATGLTPEDLLSDAKQQSCPGCHIRTTKDNGCNHLTCTQCGADWCWQCMHTMKLDDVTDHYRLSMTCTLRGYSEETETARMRAAIATRTDVSEERKESALRLLLHRGRQTATDL